jgi:hypothetical protein
MSSTTTTPAEADTRYRNRPSWAIQDPELLERPELLWERSVGEAEPDVSVCVSRRDSLIGDTFDGVGEPYVFVSFDAADDHLPPAQAREMAALLVQAADLAEDGK